MGDFVCAYLIHVGQLAIQGRQSLDDLIENVFNFPTLAEAYRIAALDLSNRVGSAASPEDEKPDSDAV